MDSAAFTIWDPSQPNAKMKIINIPGQGPAQLIETVSNIGGASTSGQAEQIILQTHDGQEFLVDENEIGRIDQIPPENLIYMAADDGSLIQGEVVHVQSDDIHQEVIQQDQEYMECEVTEEVITDDWVQTDGQECVQVTVDQLGATAVVGTAEDDLAVPLPTDQDEYTTSRPYPCDFCRRRFRKKANLMNHIIAHSNDRPHVCNLCGAQYTRRSDLLNHLKLHAYVPDDHEESLRNDPDEYEYDLSGSPSPDLKRRSFSEDEDDLLIPVPTQFMAPPPAPLPRVPKKPRAKPSGSSARSGKKSSTSTSRSRQSQAQRHQETKFNPSVEPFVNLPPRFPVIDDRKPFVCQKCGVSFAREKALASHARIHGGDSPFDCETCGHRFWDRVMLQEHIRQRHAANLVAAPLEEAGIPSVMTITRDEADQASSNEEEVEGQYYCDSCGTMFQRRELLKRHIKQVHAVREQKYEPISQIVRQRQQHQKQRLEEDDNEEEEDTENQYEEETESQQPLSCNVCGDTFVEALDLLAHAEVHARFEPYKCQLCRETFLDENAIKEHVQKQHSQELTDTSCVVCGKLCKNHAALLKHAWEHSRERTKLFGSHCCSKCGKTFHNKARLKRHMVSHRNKSVRCEICQEEFPDGRSLMNHRHSHTKTRQFPCHECGKTFGSRSSQQIHLRIHSGERPYGCRFCWKAFADGGTLRKHERVHTGEKPYGCSVCPRAFNQRVVLREHIRSHHSASDAKRGTATQPYFCSVCTQLFETSMELIQHLIQHSDMNTAMKRQPPTFPRKYKRRRKLKTDDTEQVKYGSKGKKKETNVTYEETEQGAMDDEDLLKNPAEILLEYGAGTSNKKLIASPKYINSYDLLASTSAEHNKPSTVDDNGINLLSNIVVVTNPGTSTDRTFKFIKTESTKGRGGKQTTPPAGTSGNHPPGSSTSGSRPRMIHTQKTRVAVNDGKRKTKTVITKDIKSHPEGASTPYSTLEFKRSKNRTVPTYREIPSDKISSESFPLLDDGREDDGDGDDQSDSNQDALEALSSCNSQRHKQEVPNYEDLLNQNLLMEISRKDKYIDKYNSDIVNDLEEILRSPIKNSNNNVPPAVIMATPKASHYSNNNSQDEQYDEDDSTFTADEPEEKPRKASRKQQLKKISKESAQQSLTSALRSQRLTRRQLEREVNFLREAYTPDPTNSAMRIKQEKGSPDKLSAMLLNDIQSSSSSSASMALINPKQEPMSDAQAEEPPAPPAPVHIFQCEMCSAVFNERSQLLLHVPVHI
ncbi:zinc finger protein 836-like [Ochlerotatus camptorhynchus]|uniref:zinc finger protein 836-like n=1 Tax=Ochlerotatus camptorhynchus TaxID=644619 RepID=UPI0031CEAAE4